jgi:hypothetical protein
MKWDAGATIDPTTHPAGNLILTTGIPSNYRGKVYFSYLFQTQSRKVQKFKKPYGRTTQFSAGLHCQAQNQHRTELVKGYLEPPIFAQAANYHLTHVTRF